MKKLVNPVLTIYESINRDHLGHSYSEIHHYLFIFLFVQIPMQKPQISVINPTLLDYYFNIDYFQLILVIVIFPPVITYIH